MSAVTLTIVHEEMEAEALCGLLRTDGIGCAYRMTPLASAVWGGTPAIGGPTEVLVDEADVERARELLPGSDPGS